MSLFHHQRQHRLLLINTNEDVNVSANRHRYEKMSTNERRFSDARSEEVHFVSSRHSIQ
jgi:hypothetical protein